MSFSSVVATELGRQGGHGGGGMKGYDESTSTVDVVDDGFKLRPHPH